MKRRKPRDLGGIAAETPEALFEMTLGRPARKLADEIDLEFESNPFRSFERRLLVATSGGRVGSHVLLQGLLNHGIKVNEYFNVDTISATCARRGLATLEDYCRFRLKRAARGGAFGVKGKTHILIPLWKSGEIPAHFDDWAIIYLYRRDVVRQAVSEVKAQITGSWRSAQEPTREVTDEDYDGPRIGKNIEKMMRAEKDWEDVFAVFGLSPMRIVYEELAAEPQAVIERAAAFANLTGQPLEQTTSPVEVQADALNERWTARFRADYPDFDYGRGSPR